MKKPEAPKPAAKKPAAKTQTVQPARKTAIGQIDVAKAPAAAAVAKAPKKPFNPLKFFNEVKLEAKRVTWTSGKETWITTVMVLIMVVLAGLFFYLVDGALGFITTYVTKLGQ